MGISGIDVTFRHVTDDSHPCCAVLRGSSEIPSCSASETSSTIDGIGSATVKFVELSTGATWIQVFRFQKDAKMNSLFSVLSAHAPSFRYNICYNIEADDGSSFKGSWGVLSPDDEIPKFVVCQRMSMPISSDLVSMYWVRVYIVILERRGALRLGHMPALVPTSPTFTPTDIWKYVGALFQLSSIELEYLLANPLLSCEWNDRKLVLSEFHHQIEFSACAIIYRALQVGDVAHVEIDSATGSRIAQGIVIGKKLHEGATYYDIQEVATSIVFEKISCLRAIPL